MANPHSMTAMIDRLQRYNRRYWALPFGLRLGIVAWLVLVIGISVRLFTSSPRSHTVYPIYRCAALALSDQSDTYASVPPLDIYRYSPVTSFMLWPTITLSERTGEYVWRLFSALICAYSIFRAVQHGTTFPLTVSQKGYVFACSTPFLLASLNNGQLNILLLAFLLLGTSSIVNRAMKSAAFWLALATFCKIYPGIIGLIFALKWPRSFGLSYCLFLVAGLLCPFLFFPADYLNQQFQEWLSLVVKDNRHLNDLPRTTRDFHYLLRLYLSTPNEAVYSIIQFATLLFLIFQTIRFLHPLNYSPNVRRERLEPRAQSLIRPEFTVLYWGLLWILLFGPAAESCTYSLIGPSLSLLLLIPFTKIHRSGFFSAATSSQSSLKNPGNFLGFIKQLHQSDWFLFIGSVFILLPVVGMAFPFGKMIEMMGFQPIGLVFLFVGEGVFLCSNYLTNKNAIFIRHAVPSMKRHQHRSEFREYQS